MVDPVRVRDIFDRAIQLPPSDRAAYVQREAQDDTAVRQEVERLISAYENLGDIFETDSGERDDSVAGATAAVPQVVGAYRIVRELGRGGAGTVYLAVRHDEQFKKTVAIKLLRPEVDTVELVRRFRHERQILASIEHPYIAKLLDGGSTIGGSPYLVMEYIDGLPIDVYCDRNGVTTRERLELFCKVCAAIQFAHQNLVVHRDIKPGNILVTSDGVPKLLDFGIAKLLDPAAFSLTIDLTRAEFRPMTPEYASPEQIRGETVTTASDVYSLGVLLYRLLTGRRPYRLLTGDLPELARAICDEDPKRPSTVVDSAEGRLPTSDPAGPPVRLPPERLSQQLRGDLDNIVLKALRKEPDRRYVSAEQLADDIQRHLSDLPIRAGADTARYRATKFLRRHKMAVATVASFVLFVAAAAIVLGVQAATIAHERDRAEAARQRAEREGARAAAINEFLLRTLGGANPMTGTGRDVTLASALSAAAATAQFSFKDDPEIEAGVLNVVGMTFVELGRYTDAAPLLDRAVQLRTTALGETHADVAESLESKATLLRWRGEFDEAERLYRRALIIARRTSSGSQDRTAQVLQGLGLNFSQRGDEKEALTFFDEGLALARTGSVADRVRAELLASAGVSYRRLEQYPQAEAMYREALEIQRRLLGPSHPEVGTLLNNLGVLMNASGRYVEAEATHREALRVRQAALGPGHPYVANSLLNLAHSLESRGDWTGAVALYDQAAKIVRAALGPDHPRLAQVLRNWGVLLGNQNKTTEAVPLLREVLRIRRKAFKEESREVADALTVLGHSLRHAGSTREGEDMTRQALAVTIKVLGPDNESVATSRKDLGSLLCSQGKLEAGLELLREATDFFIRHPSVQPQSGAIIRGEYGACLTKARRFAEAEVVLLSAHGHMTQLGPDHRWAKQAASRLANLYEAWGKPAEAARFTSR